MGLEMSGILYLCATPIGNLGDVTLRVLDTLRGVDLIAAEDTRNSLKLLNHYEIKTPMVSYHEHNKGSKGIELVNVLIGGKDVALITDAGTPGISDPGEDLVVRCQEAGIAVTSLPGAVACITALTLSGLPTRRFAFEGFLPSERAAKRERQRILLELASESRTMIFYEAPHHLLGTLRALWEMLGDRKLTVCRELTKRFETVMVTTLEEAIMFHQENEPRGEYVLVIAGVSLEEKEERSREKWNKMSLEEHIALYEGQGKEHKEAMRLVAKDRGISRRDVYQKLL
jgi:16S rRNA (cytidine1402-2'-O)-methyltransferase